MTTAKQRKGGKLSKEALFKTEMCKNLTKPGGCPYGDRCQYAHSLEDLRVRATPCAYKTRLCKTFATTGSCPYGTRCRFVHGDEAEQEAMDLRQQAMLRTLAESRRATSHLAQTSDLSGSNVSAPLPAGKRATAHLDQTSDLSETSVLPVQRDLGTCSGWPAQMCLNCSEEDSSDGGEDVSDAKNDETFGESCHSCDADPAMDLHSYAHSAYLFQDAAAPTRQDAAAPTRVPLVPSQPAVTALQQSVASGLYRQGSAGNSIFRKYHHNFEDPLTPVKRQDSHALRIVDRLAMVLDEDARDLMRITSFGTCT